MSSETKVAFDPKKPFGTICGVSSYHVAARFAQGDHYYNNQKQQVFAGEKDPANVPDPPPPPPSASEQLTDLEEKLAKAKEVVTKTPTKGNRTKVTQLENAITKLQAQ